MTRLISLIGGVGLVALSSVALAQTAPADNGTAGAHPWGANSTPSTSNTAPSTDNTTPSTANTAPSTANTAPSAASTATPSGPYSTSTTQLGVLFADPAAKAVLAKYLPDLVKSPDILDRASGMTLQELKQAVGQYAPNLFNDKVMAEIDADLAALPPPKN